MDRIRPGLEIERRDSSAKRPRPLPRNVRLLGVASLLNDIASEIVYPLMPQFLLAVLGGSRFQLGIIEGVAESAASLLKLGAGAWSDQTGTRRGFVVIGYAMAGFARPLIGLASAPWHLFVARTADRIGKGIRTAPRDALIADSTEPEIRGRAFGFHRAMDHLGAAVGPLFASAFLLIWPGRLRLLFLLTLMPGLIAVALLAFGLKKKRTAEPTSQPLRLTLRPFDWNFRLYLLALMIFTLGNSSDAFLLVRAAELGVATVWLPVLWSAFHAVKSTGSLLAGRAVDGFGPRPLILLGWIIYAEIYLLFAVANQAWQVWPIFLFYGLFFAVTEPAEKALVARLAGADQRGMAFGWFNCAIGIAALPSSMIFGLLYETFGPLVAFGCGSGLALLAAILLLNAHGPHTGDRPHAEIR